MTGYSDEDVETAVRILYERILYERRSMFPTRPDVTENILSRDARAVLDAVAPTIATRAWDEGFIAGANYSDLLARGIGPYDDIDRNPYTPDGDAT